MAQLLTHNSSEVFSGHLPIASAIARESKRPDCLLCHDGVVNRTEVNFRYSTRSDICGIVAILYWIFVTLYQQWSKKILLSHPRAKQATLKACALRNFLDLKTQYTLITPEQPCTRSCSCSTSSRQACQSSAFKQHASSWDEFEACVNRAFRHHIWNVMLG